MTGHERKNRDGTPLLRARNTSNTGSTSKSPIKTPPRVALAQSRSSDKDDSKSSKAGSPKLQTAANETSPESRSTDGDVSMETCKQEIDQKLASRDLKIANLENETEVMEAEFARELTQLGHRLTGETEKASLWERKHSTLNQQYLKTDTDLRMLQHDYAVREKQLEERDKDIKTRISSLMIDRDAFREGYNATQRDLKAKEREVSELRNQVRDLKKFVSTNTRIEGQMTDEVFGEMMQNLGNGLQNWVISNFRRSKIDLSKLGPDPHVELSQLLPLYINLESISKVHLIQSIVSLILVKNIFDLYFAGLPVEIRASLADMEQNIGALVSGPSVNQWRSATLSIVKKDALEKLRAETESIIETVVQEIKTALNTIMDLPKPEIWSQSLQNLITDAIDLSRLLRVQKAAFRVQTPPMAKDRPTYFDVQSMEDVGGEDDPILEKRRIRCVTFPGIIKEGDENGFSVHLTNVISKARVLCEPA